MSRKDGWEKTGEAIEKGPFRGGVKIIVIVAGLMFVGGIASYTLGWFGDAAQLAKEELSPRALLKKYEWFKDAAAQLDKKQADIGVYQSRLTNLKADYEGVPRKDWDRTDKQSYTQWAGEVAGVTASYNGLAAEYNAQMAKINWAFTNVGDLPQGASTVLPREFRVYASQ